jgi:hypothetical protein
MRHCYAIAERGNGRAWWLSFPGPPGVFSVADDAGEIAMQATDALSAAVDVGLSLPVSVEDGAKPPVNLSEFEAAAMVVVISFDAVSAKVA